jgi:cell fate regulator YaaT (PSP1 superfamily)
MKREVIGVRFQPVGKKYYFDANEMVFQILDNVIVETIQGLEFAEVVEANKIMDDEVLSETLKPILRRANEDDLEAYQENLKSYDSILEETQSLIQKHRLKMRLLNIHYTLDRAKLIIEYIAPERVDFRELLKDLTRSFKTRLELRQVGARDSAKHLGGIGPCGLILCCNTFLGEFDSISIKMAKNQNLALSPVNVSGLCGKLLCCLKYEDEMYTEHRTGLPKEQSQVETSEGIGTVLANNVLERKVRVFIENKGVQYFSVDDLVVEEAYE